MKQKFNWYYQLVKMCLPLLAFQMEPQENLWANSLEIATPVMSYVYQEDEDVDDMTVLAAWENAKVQKERQAKVEAENEKARAEAKQQEKTESLPTPAPPVDLAANPTGEKWVKQQELNRDKLMDFDYLMKTFYRVDSTTNISPAEFPIGDLMAKDLRLDMSQPGPLVLIYHTHSQEGFADSDGSENMSVMGLGNRLADLLQNTYGIPVLHHMGKYDVDGRDYAYANALPNVEQVLAENPSVQVVIDLHRDGVPETAHLVTEVNGKPTAKVMFFNGLSKTTSTGPIDYLQNPNLNDNLATSLQMQLAAAELYPGFTRPVFLKGYRYNMHLKPRCMLIEVGAQTNTYEEVYNAMEPLANIISYVLLNK